MENKPVLNILKIGGKILANEKELNRLLLSFAKLTGPKILVHGGGAKASKLAEQLGLPVLMKDGRRITDAGMLEVVTMVYAGWYNKNLVSKLQNLGCDAMGLCGADLNLILADKRPVGQIDYGFVGDIKAINTERLENIFQLGFSPVFSAITHDDQSQLLNTNADTIATELAIALTPFYEVRLQYCFELPGLLRNEEIIDTLVPRINFSTYQKMKKEGMITSGMIPKLDNAFRAIESKVSKVSIGNVSSLAENKATELC